jgi:hypothetical protein
MAALDLSALSHPEAWRYFLPAGVEGEDPEADALAALRAELGASYTDAPDDGPLTTALEAARDFLEAATGRFFVARTGVLHLDGNRGSRLWLPFPVVSVSQLEGAGVTEILIGTDTTAVDSEFYTVNDGAGLGSSDPRDNPWIELVAPEGATFATRSPEPGNLATWPLGVASIHVTATWGYLDQAGAVPALVRRALALLVIRHLVTPDDPDGLEDLHRGALVAESTQGRSYQLGDRAVGGGPTTARELDLLIARFRAPARVTLPSPPPRRRSRRLY